MSDKDYPYIAKNPHGVELLVFRFCRAIILNEPNKGVIHIMTSSWQRRIKNITREYLDNTCGLVESVEHMDFIDSLAVANGFNVKNSRGVNLGHPISYFEFEGDCLTFCAGGDQDKGFREITIPIPPKSEVKSGVEEVECNAVVEDVKTFAGVATIGKGKHKSRSDGKKTKCYKVWEGMITRCYVVNSAHYHRYGGRGVTVCSEWLNFQMFADWYFSQKNNSKPNFQIDKDLRVIGNKVYRPDFCEIIPSRINSLLISTNANRGNLPVGVHALKDKFKASCRDEFGSKVYLGTFKTQTEAFCAYRNFKKGVVVTIANEEYSKGNISEKIHKSLININIEAFPD